MSFWNFGRNEDGGDELYIDGEIMTQDDWWVDGAVVARDFRRALAKRGDVTVFINSPGGDVFAGAELYTALKEHKGSVTVKVSGIAASAASVIAMAGDRVLMSPVAYMMIHDPWTYTAGNARDMERVAERLRTVGEGIINAYEIKTGKSRDEIAAMMASETYMNAQQCVALGFADEVIDYGATVSESGDAAASRASAAPMTARNYTEQRYCAMIRDHLPRVEPDPTEEPVKPDYDERKKRGEIASRAKIIHDHYTR